MNQSISINDVLSHFGITENTISKIHRRELDEQGYTIFHDVIDSTWLNLLRKKFEELIDREGEQAGIEANQMEGVRRLADLTNKGEIFDALYTHPLVLGAAYHVIKRPFKLYLLMDMIQCINKANKSSIQILRRARRDHISSD